MNNKIMKVIAKTIVDCSKVKSYLDGRERKQLIVNVTVLQCIYLHLPHLILQPNYEGATNHLANSNARTAKFRAS